MGIDPSAPEMTFLLVMLHTGTTFAVILYLAPMEDSLPVRFRRRAGGFAEGAGARDGRDGRPRPDPQALDRKSVPARERTRGSRVPLLKPAARRRLARRGGRPGTPLGRDEKGRREESAHAQVLGRNRAPSRPVPAVARVLALRRDDLRGNAPGHAPRSGRGLQLRAGRDPDARGRGAGGAPADQGRSRGGPSGVERGPVRARAHRNGLQLRRGDFSPCAGCRTGSRTGAGAGSAITASPRPPASWPSRRPCAERRSPGRAAAAAPAACA